MPIIGMPFVVSREERLTQPETLLHFSDLFQQLATLLLVEILTLQSPAQTKKNHLGTIIVAGGRPSLLLTVAHQCHSVRKTAGLD